MHALRRAATALLVALLAAVPAGTAASRSGGATTCFGKAATVVGTQASERLTGTRRADVIVGRGGDDRIDGGRGRDLICGGVGADRLEGGRGSDRLDGGLDRNADGAAGHYLVGDVLVGGPGDDRLDGGVDSRGDQRRRPDTFSWADARGPVVVDLSGEVGTATGRGRDTIVLGRTHGIEGSPYADTITGSRSRDWIHGREGGDAIGAGAGADLVYPDGRGDERGRDTVDAGKGADLVSSLSGRDTIRAGRGGDFVEAFSGEPTAVDLGPGDDYVGQRVTPGSGAAADGGAGDDVVTFYGGLLGGQQPAARFVVDERRGVTRASGDVEATGVIAGFERHRLVGPLRWRFHGRDGADRVWAIEGGPLQARGYAGADAFTGSERPDRLDGGPGSDSADGRGGDDRCLSIERAESC